MRWPVSEVAAGPHDRVILHRRVTALKNVADSGSQAFFCQFQLYRALRDAETNNKWKDRETGS